MSEFQRGAMSIYPMLINNLARHIRLGATAQPDQPPMDAFTASEVIAAALCKRKEDVLADILRASNYSMSAPANQK